MCDQTIEKYINNLNGCVSLGAICISLPSSFAGRSFFDVQSAVGRTCHVIQITDDFVAKIHFFKIRS